MRLWIDLDHSPHVPLFYPLLAAFQRRGAETVVTTRDFNQTIGLCDLWKIAHHPIGVHGGGNVLGKIANLCHRSGQLVRFIRPQNVDWAISHGSRTQVVAAATMGIPSIVMDDYEYQEDFLFRLLARYILMPSAIPDARLRRRNLRKLRRYEGYKEEIYLPFFKPYPNFRKEIGEPGDCILVTIRPPAIAANYHDQRSEQIMLRVLEKTLATPGCIPLVISRTREDRRLITRKFGDRVQFLEKAVDGLQLIWNSDVFVGGGGTMNREAALLGVPVYSIFTGRKPFLDERLAAEGRLRFIDSCEAVDQISLRKRAIPLETPVFQQDRAELIAAKILDLATGANGSQDGLRI